MMNGSWPIDAACTLGRPAIYDPPRLLDYRELNQALDKLRDLNTDLTQRFIDACAHVVNADLP